MTNLTSDMTFKQAMVALQTERGEHAQRIAEIDAQIKHMRIVLRIPDEPAKTPVTCSGDEPHPADLLGAVRARTQTKTPAKTKRLAPELVNKSLMKPLYGHFADYVLRVLELCGPLTGRSLSTAILNLGYKGRGHADRDTVIHAIHKLSADPRNKIIKRSKKLFGDELYHSMVSPD
jgi:hypothetical protein